MRRARKVCQRCHRRKIRCDLETVIDGPCSPCAHLGSPCLLRPSNQGRRVSVRVTPSDGDDTSEAVSSRSGYGAVNWQDNSAGLQQDIRTYFKNVYSFSPVFDTVPLEFDDKGLVTSLLVRVLRLLARYDGSSSMVQLEQDIRKQLYDALTEQHDRVSTLQAALLLCHAASSSALYALNRRVDVEVDFRDTPRGSVSEVGLYAHPSIRGGNATFMLLEWEYRRLSPAAQDMVVLVCMFTLSSKTGPGLEGECKGRASDTQRGFGLDVASILILRQEDDRGGPFYAQSPRGVSTPDLCARPHVEGTNTHQARERFMAICQGLPLSIDLDFCSIEPPSLQDFPPSRAREAQIFMHRVKLADVIGQINKQLVISRRTRRSLPTQEIARTLVTWLTTLPQRLQLTMDNIEKINRDIGLLHLPYLNAISLVYLYASEEQLPQASVASVLAAAFTARIFGDLLQEDQLDIVPEEMGWYAAIAAMALIHVRPLEMLAPHALADIAILQAALKTLSTRWPSSKMLGSAVAGVLLTHSVRSLSDIQPVTNGAPASLKSAPSQLDDLCAGDDVSWPEFFPFASVHSSALVGVILEECQSTFPQLWTTTLPGGFDSFLRDLDTVMSET